MNQSKLVAYGITSAIAMALGGRLIYTEIARENMYDYKKQVSALLNNEQLKNQWSQKLDAISRKYDSQSAVANCGSSKDNSPQLPLRQYSPLSNLLYGTPSENACLDPIALAETNTTKLQ